MSQDCYFYTSDFRFKDDASRQKFDSVLQEVMEDYAHNIKLEPDLKGGFSLSFNTANVGDSFQESVSELTSALGPLVVGGFKATVVTDSMSEENTEHFYGGPDKGTIEAFEDDEKIKEVMENLNPRQKARLVDAISKGKKTASDEMPKNLGSYIVNIHTENAGGGSMIDFIELTDGKVVGINDEAICVYANKDSFHEESQEGLLHSIWYQHPLLSPENKPNN